MRPSGIGTHGTYTARLASPRMDGKDMAPPLG